MNRSNWRARDGFGEEELLLVDSSAFSTGARGSRRSSKATAKLLKEGVPVRLVFIGGRTGSSDLTNVDYANEYDETDQGSRDRRSRSPYRLFHARRCLCALLATDLCALPYLDGASLRVERCMPA
jgi:hypothetical protein